MQKTKVRSLLFNELLKILDTAFSLDISKSQSDAAVPARDVTGADAAADAAAATAAAATTAADVRRPYHLCYIHLMGSILRNMHYYGLQIFTPV